MCGKKKSITEVKNKIEKRIPLLSSENIYRRLQDEMSPRRGRKQSQQHCGRWPSRHCFISGPLTLTNLTAKRSKVNSSLASMASTKPTPCVLTIQNIRLTRVNPPVGTIHRGLITIAACSDFPGDRTGQPRFHPNPRGTFPLETGPCHIRHDKTSKQGPRQSSRRLAATGQLCQYPHGAVSMTSTEVTSFLQPTAEATHCMGGRSHQTLGRAI